MKKDIEISLKNLQTDYIDLYQMHNVKPAEYDTIFGEDRAYRALLEAKEEIHKNRADLEREIKERRGEMSKTERRLTQKEETLDRKTDAEDKKNEELTRRLANVQKSREEAEQYKQQQLERLESISGLTRDEAKQYLVDSIEQEAQHDAAMMLKSMREKLSPLPFSAALPTT